MSEAAFRREVDGMVAELSAYTGEADKASIAAAILAFVFNGTSGEAIPGEFQGRASALKHIYSSEVSALKKLRMDIYYTDRTRQFVGLSVGSNNSNEENLSGGYRKSYRKTKKHIRRRRTTRRKQRRSQRHRA